MQSRWLSGSPRLWEVRRYGELRANRSPRTPFLDDFRISDDTPRTEFTLYPTEMSPSSLREPACLTSSEMRLRVNTLSNTKRLKWFGQPFVVVRETMHAQVQ